MNASLLRTVGAFGIAFGALSLSSSLCHAGHVVWSQPANTTYASPSSAVTTDPPTMTEVADDFELHGVAERLVITGSNCSQCAVPAVAGVNVRFYQWTPQGPGSVVSQYTLSGSDPNFLYNAAGPATLDITLPQPFVADGRYFLSVQMVFNGGGYWGWWMSNYGSPQGSSCVYRTDGGTWGPYVGPGGAVSADLCFTIWGDDGNPPPPGTDPCGTWSPSPMPIPAQATRAIVRDVAAMSATEAYAVGEYSKPVIGGENTFTMAHRWDGVSWSLLDPPSPTACSTCTYATFDAVAVAGPNDIWAAGGKRVQGPDGFLGTHIFVARYNGSSWTVMNTPLTTGGSGAHVNDILVISPSSIWFFGEYVQPQMALAMHWNGSNFTVVNTPFPSGGTPGWGLEAGDAVSPNDIWAVGGGSDGDYSATGYIVHWNGSSWTRVLGPAPGTYQRLWDVVALASNDVWAVGDYFEAGQGYFPLFLHWDGSSWTQVPSPAGSRGLVAFDADNIYACGGGIVHWDGIAWTQVEDFDQVTGASTLAMAKSDLCSMITVGRQLTVGSLMPFAATIQPGAVGNFSLRPGDVDHDQIVNINDLLAVINGWGACPTPPSACPADLTLDQTVNINDLLMVIQHWD